MTKISKTLLIQAIEEYRIAGKDLMYRLGRKFDLDISIPSEYEELISRGNKLIPRKGQISKRWNYNFHGGQCGFYNKKYQQSVEVNLSNSPHFGDLDAWFVMMYLESTEKYKEFVENIDWLEIKEMIHELIELGEIEGEWKG
ncbi:MAG: hypothetical protein R3E32_21170 [Chitinophagales bacterium]